MLDIFEFLHGSPLIRLKNARPKAGACTINCSLPKYSKILCKIIFCLVAIEQTIHASPVSGFGASLLSKPELGFFYARRGFNIQGPEGWRIEKQNLDQKENEFSNMYFSPVSSQTKLSVETDTLRADISLEAFTKKWIRDYSTYGFDVLGAKTFKSENAKGLVVDFKHTQQKTQLRQVIFVKNQTAVIVTCSDQEKNFTQSLKYCNDTIQSFRWQ